VDPVSGGADLASAVRNPGEERRRVDGLGGPVDWLTGLIHGFSFFLFFYSINRGGQATALVKATINRDLSAVAVAKTASVKFSVVVK
jgi:hypothetical protein